MTKNEKESTKIYKYVPGIIKGSNTVGIKRIVWLFEDIE